LDSRFWGTSEIEAWQRGGYGGSKQRGVNPTAEAAKCSTI
jgi:hypothetical protein